MHTNEYKNMEYLAKYGRVSKWIAKNLVKCIQIIWFVQWDEQKG